MTNSFQSCACCADLLQKRFDRRRILIGTAAVGLSTALPGLAFAAPKKYPVEGKYEAMLLSCIDPRFPENTFNYMKGRSLTGKYSQFSIAGSAIGVVAPAFKDWHQAFWDNLGASIQLHAVPSVIAINHRDCGAAKIAYGEKKVIDAKAETETHKASLMQFRKEVAKRQPKLKVETGLMALDGTIEMFS